MFEYFEDHYVWNMAVNLALAMGGNIGDIDDASRSLRPLAKTRGHSAAEQFYAAWMDLGMKLKRLAANDEARGRSLSAGAKYRRAFIYLIQAERMQRPDFAPRQQAFREALDCFSRFLATTQPNCRRVEVPYQNTTLPALLVEPQITGTDFPCMVHFDGLDVTKEIIYLLGIPDALAARGIATLVVDNPGVGESLRLKNSTIRPKQKFRQKPLSTFSIDARHRSRSDRHDGAVARRLSCARAAAFEPRFKCCVAWGANYDWGETQRRRYEAKEQRLPVPHYWDHVAWVFGKSTVEEVIEVSAKLSLKGILHQIKCPILVVHGENDRQIPLEQAQQLVADCVSSPKAELYVHTLADGGAEHCGIDNVALTREVMCDWIAEVLGGNTAPLRRAAQQ